MVNQFFWHKIKRCTIIYSMVSCNLFIPAIVTVFYSSCRFDALFSLSKRSNAFLSNSTTARERFGKEYEHRASGTAHRSLSKRSNEFLLLFFHFERCVVPIVQVSYSLQDGFLAVVELFVRLNSSLIFFLTWNVSFYQTDNKFNCF